VDHLAEKLVPTFSIKASIVMFENLTRGINTDRPSRLNTRLYSSPLPPGSLGRTEVYQAPLLVYALNNAGVRKTPRMFPRVDWVTVNAVFPCACPVYSTVSIHGFA
jgi:hypothetical protein